MPDEITTPDALNPPTDTATDTTAASDATDTAEQPQLSEDQKKKIADATGPIWKKLLLWGGGFILIVLGAIGILYILKGEPPAKAVNNTIDQTKAEIAKSDLDAKIKVAEAEGAEKAVITKLNEIKEMKNENDRLEALKNLL